MFVAAPSGEISVIEDRGISSSSRITWTLREGSWQSIGERRGDLAVADCDGDGTAEPLFGLRCETGGTSGYPAFGRMRCEAGGLACRAPLTPAYVVQEHRMHDLAAVAASDVEIFALRGARAEVYGIGADGSLAHRRTLALRRAGHDLAVTGDAVLVGDPAGVSMYDTTTGALLSSVPTCGKARRVFVDGTRAYVVGLLSVTVVDVSDPAAPVVEHRLRLLTTVLGLALRSCGDCTWLDRGFDRLYDGLGAGGGVGRTAATYRDGRLFVHLLAAVHVLDFRDGSGPTVEASVPVGLVTELRAEDRFLYGNLTRHRTWVATLYGDGAGWLPAGSHDVPRWVDGTVDLGRWTVNWEPGTIEVGLRQ
jgi:hypothetical protein